MRKHYRVRSENKRKTSVQIAALIGGRPPEPFEKARVTVTRFSIGVPDHDNLVGSVKDLCDCMTTPSLMANGKVRNKFGIGLIRDDSPVHCELVVLGVKCRRAEQRTEVVIEEIVG
ncbi:hypothetical protein [Acetobacter oeni]|uniref:Uncharacterized protein n=1 Tax=Acetobacter oeni TaxID=304077 RepID=A0A511XJQ6_9PROT|nr:hypothetical protein [Acetobacter oeni]MBB3883387.1 Holliday junction resolvase RusA-like endonuclease [Acetobacter oeni]NHO19366.1 hypothetical protein [Acetobacter oeni]GBR03923.1 hypothetical protein AA21952_1226 [Acetobacter oeni LMG 21952]GEN63169.1 hypothetical protein AOE01nite_13930 [Acetobacter oeni]